MERWILKGNKENTLDIEKLNITKTTANLLSKRGIVTNEEAEHFLNIDYDDLETPLKMRDMIIAGNIVLSAKSSGKNIAIVGDYDVDGVMSTVILLKGLQTLGMNPIYRIPAREEGYGINNNIVDELKEKDVSLIITCDNGIAASETVKYAKSLGVDVIVTDHHEVPKIDGKDSIPAADAVLNPKRSDCDYPFKELCGAGVSFKLISYLYKIQGIDEEKEKALLPYVAVATICDMMNLVGENRIFVKYGLEILNSSTISGFDDIVKLSGFQKELDVSAIGFLIGPMINSAGRIETADIGVELFMSDSITKRTEIVELLKKLNTTRQSYTEEGFKKAIDFIETHEMQRKFPVLVVLDEDLHPAVAGIVAGRIKEKYYRPTIVLSGKDELKGSGRSIEAYDMFTKVSEIKSYLTAFGGHQMACGLTIQRENLRDFVKDLNNNSNLTREDLVKTIYLDDSLTLRDINFDFYDEIMRLKPFGKGNEDPIFGFKNLKIVRLDVLGKNKNVLKFTFTDGENYVEGIYFQTFDNFKKLMSSKYDGEELNYILQNKKELFIDVVASVDVNKFMGNTTLQLSIKSVRP
ncbi:single-stranded-DNA-specific exonuclease RecJ [Peptoniphilus duerdenii ATCC BAA-1640]|uniref:Single-stranded-DNA-specific exonuclease RecJ n=1 Tax=Peptoniphilus duerdenii ATCC BAA-1640 TaxID=862517 RepID=E0NN61_9FIRM|nr:single-stranded-DNA-specific exonuclease RecJ [Peptoniphilus duerdenii]EFM24734.1 single-stranded-DNA-specific exonuclease RecJ [Peptoniphilus duerdenii ATCC BAA-1640]